ncbi:MAG: ABC transporter permease [Bacteroidales bacterium]|nr:ABC transporter permease [Candidatus Cryptobacteroides fimicaballi]
MNFRNIKIIISREYLNRVKKKSFLVTTFLVPVLMAALVLVPVIVMMTSEEKTKVIAVYDRSGVVAQTLEDTKTIDYVISPDIPVDSLKRNMKELGYDAVLDISEINGQKSVTADLTSVNPMGVEMASNINNRIEDAIEDYRINSYGIDGLAQIMQDVKADIKLNTYTIGDDGEEKISETGVYAAFSMILGMIIFIFVTMFGSMVMSSVIEEKTSRVVEVLVSSVRATELMFGKIIGIACVALTQFFLWIVLTFALVAGASAFMGTDILKDKDPVEMVESMGVDPAAMEEVMPSEGPAGEISIVLDTIKNMDMGSMLLIFLVFFVFGYLLYASMFAAIGSAVENEGDSSQLQLPVTIPLMIGYFIAIYAFRAPDSAIAFWGSMIPFTSPIVMIARAPFGVPAWEIAVSMVLLIVTFVVLAWLSAKIYKVGILMFGKKTTWKDLWKWLKQS